MWSVMTVIRVAGVTWLMVGMVFFLCIDAARTFGKVTGGKPASETPAA